MDRPSCKGHFVFLHDDEGGCWGRAVTLSGGSTSTKTAPELVHSKGRGTSLPEIWQKLTVRLSYYCSYVNLLSALMSADSLVALKFTSPPEPVYKAQREYSGEQTMCLTIFPAAWTRAPPRLPSNHPCMYAWITPCCKLSEHVPDTLRRGGPGKCPLPQQQFPERRAAGMELFPPDNCLKQVLAMTRSRVSVAAGVKWSPDGACLLTSSDDSWYCHRLEHYHHGSVHFVCGMLAHATNVLAKRPPVVQDACL